MGPNTGISLNHPFWQQCVNHLISLGIHHLWEIMAIPSPNHNWGSTDYPHLSAVFRRGRLWKSKYTFARLHLPLVSPGSATFLKIGTQPFLQLQKLSDQSQCKFGSLHLSHVIPASIASQIWGLSYSSEEKFGTFWRSSECSQCPPSRKTAQNVSKVALPVCIRGKCKVTR